MGRLLDEDIINVLHSHSYEHPKVCIETGTWLGTQLLISARHFVRVHGIELDRHYHDVCVEAARTAGAENITMHLGDTREILPQLLDQHSDKPVFVILDAHYFATADPPLQKSEFPLWVELELLKNRQTPDIISVDDVHTFGVNREDLRYEEGAEEWETVTTDSILEFMGDRVVDHGVLGDSFLLWMRDDRET